MEVACFHLHGFVPTAILMLIEISSKMEMISNLVKSKAPKTIRR